MNTLKKVSFLWLIFALFSCGDANSQIKNVGVDEFIKTYKQTPSAQLLDVRTPGEWAQGKIASSKLINFNSPSFANEITKLDKSKPVFVYCAVGGRSAMAAQTLSKAGFKVYNLQGAGYSSLASKGLK